MRDGGGVSYFGFSGRHVRLKYQAVSAALVAALISYVEVKSISIPGFVQFSGVPPTWLVHIGVILFALFSLVSFHFQTKMERKHIPLTGMLFKEEIKRQSNDLIDRARSLTGDSFEVYKKTIVEELSSLPPRSYDDPIIVNRFQAIAEHFYNIQTAAKFAQIQLANHRDAVSQEIYQGSSSFDVHYSNTVNMLAEKIELFINSVWRPNDLIKNIGGIQYSSNVIADINHLNSIAKNLKRQHESLLKDLNEYVGLKSINQETLSVQIPYGLATGLLIYSVLYPLVKFCECNI